MKKILLITALLLVMLYTGCKKNTDSNPDCNWNTVFADNFLRDNGSPGNDYGDTIIAQQGSNGEGFADLFNNSLRVWSNHCFWAVWYKQPVESNRVRISLNCSVPDEESVYEFGIGGKFTQPGTTVQSGYFGALMDGTIGIYRTSGLGTQTLVTEAYTVTTGTTYRLILTIDDAQLTFSAKDLTTGKTTSVTGSDPQPLSGKMCTINGNTINGSGVMQFDDFLIEKCE